MLETRGMKLQRHEERGGGRMIFIHRSQVYHWKFVPLPNIKLRAEAVFLK